jgi:hypothetical protein
MYLSCPKCGKKVAYYNPRVGSNRTTRFCEHKRPDGKMCDQSRKPVPTSTK